MHLRSKITLLLVVLMLTAPQLVHADTMGWEFTLRTYRLDPPPPLLPIIDTQTFFISIWDTPEVSDFSDCPGCQDVLSFADVGVAFYPDGVQVLGELYEPGFFHSGTLWTGDPHHPQFIIQESVGDGNPATGTAAVTIVAVNAPEPSTIYLFGVGVLGIIGVARRR